MNIELAKSFTPKNDNGYEDSRFHDDLISIFSKVRPEVIEGLTEFKNKTTALENKYGSLAYELVIQFLIYIDCVDEHERYLESNKFRWSTIKIREGIGKGLREVGFKPSNVTKIIGAAEYMYQLEERTIVPTRNNKGVRVDKRAKDELAFAEPLPITSKYLLSGMRAEGVKAAMEYSDTTKEWDPKTDTFRGKPLTVRVLEALKRQYPTNPDETRGRKKNNNSNSIKLLDDDPTPIVIEETIESNQYDLAKQLVAIAALIDTKEGWKDPELIEILSLEKEALMSVAHIATLPVNKPITV